MNSLGQFIFEPNCAFIKIIISSKVDLMAPDPAKDSKCQYDIGLPFSLYPCTIPASSNDVFFIPKGKQILSMTNCSKLLLLWRSNATSNTFAPKFE
ncbi:hypothetical protein D3C73_626880 [compost metagenome]